MEKILLINPGYVYYKKTWRKSPYGFVDLPLGLLYIAAVLESKGCNVKVIDSPASPQAKLIIYNDRRYYGIPPNVLKKMIQEYKPDVVGISSQFTTQEENVFQTAELVKSVDCSIPVIVGGANASCRAKYLMESSNIDIVVKSEGEKIVSDLVDYFRGKHNLKNVKGIFYRQDRIIFENEDMPYIEDLDEVPLPAYHLVDMESYLTLYKKGIHSREGGIKRAVPMITSRGCPYNCIFCSISLSMGKLWRAHSVDYVIQHIEKLYKTYRIKHIHFEDDNLMLDVNRFMRILEIFRKYNITWDTPNGIRVDRSITKDMLKEMKLSGCRSLTIGVESGDEEILNKIVKKNLRLDEVEEFAERCQKVGLPLYAFFILGFPGEDIKSMKKTIDFAMYLAKRYKVRPLNMMAIPLYGTQLYKICKENNYFSKEITPYTLSESTGPDGCFLISTEKFQARQVEHLSRYFSSRIYRWLLFNALISPISTIKKIGNIYKFMRILKLLFGF